MMSITESDVTWVDACVKKQRNLRKRKEDDGGLLGSDVRLDAAVRLWWSGVERENLPQVVDSQESSTREGNSEGTHVTILHRPRRKLEHQTHSSQSAFFWRTLLPSMRQPILRMAVAIPRHVQRYLQSGQVCFPVNAVHWILRPGILLIRFKFVNL